MIMYLYVLCAGMKDNVLGKLNIAHVVAVNGSRVGDFKFGNGAISLKSKLQECTTPATTEAEYVVVSSAAKEALWLGRLACMFRQANPNSAPVVYNDSQGVVAPLRNPIHHNASKNINVRYHFVWDCVTSRKLGLENISTANNISDGMTKCLAANRFRSLRHHMGLLRNQSDKVGQQR